MANRVQIVSVRPKQETRKSRTSKYIIASIELTSGNIVVGIRSMRRDDGRGGKLFRESFGVFIF